MRPTKGLTIDRVERALDKLAETIVFLGDDGVNALPICERLERELADMKQHEAKMDEIRARAARSKQRRESKNPSR